MGVNHAVSDNLAFIDTETTGLDPDRHEMWDLAIIVDGEEHQWHFVPRHPEVADPNALRINRFWSRVTPSHWHWDDDFTSGIRGPAELRALAATKIATLTAGRHLVGAVPWFDAEFLRRWLIANGAAPAWHYHMIDVETLAVGALMTHFHGPEPARRWDPPWDSEALSTAIGVFPGKDRHTALGDARWAKAIYEAVMGA